MSKGKEITNQEIARLLRNVAAVYRVKEGNSFKIIAYERAATSIEHATSEVKDLWDDGKLDKIPGVGASIAAHLDELFRTGKVKHFEKLFSALPEAMFEFLNIPGIGPKTALKLCQYLNIKKSEKALEKLRKAAEKGKIRIIEGFGEQSEKEILQGLAEFGRRKKRLLLPIANFYAEAILSYLKGCRLVLRTDFLGSLRRRCATVGDIDIAVASNQAKKVVDYFVSYPKKMRILEAGENKGRILLTNDVQVDLMVEPPESYGSLLQHSTGSKQHNIALREIAQKKGLSLSEHGIKIVKSPKPACRPGRSKVKSYSTEEDFYRALGVGWIPPELRENTGEIELAQKGKLPKLAEFKEIKGDLHIHSSFDIETSHDLGVSSLAEIYQKAQDLDYEYIALVEHNPSTSKHNQKQIIDLIKRKKEYIEQFLSSREKRQGKRTKKVYIFNSLEVDIKPTGERAVPDEALQILDFVIVSIHSSFRMERKRMTERILKALDHPKVKILAHPTGRKLNVREAYEVDWEVVFDFCKKHQKFLEINAWPDRLDLPDSLIREAVAQGVKLIINTDSHKLEDMDLMKYGVWTARRGWATGGDIINTFSYDKIKSYL